MVVVEFGLNQQAPVILERLSRWMGAQETAVRAADCWPLVRTVAEGAPELVIPPHVHGDHRQLVYHCIMASAVHRLWMTSKRVVLPFHPSLVDELEDSASGDLPGAIFDRLPHANPLVLFPRPLPVTTADGHRGELLGFYIYGRRAERRGQLCSTHDPQRDAIGIMAVTSLVDEHGQEKDLDFTRLTVPIGRDRFTIEDAVENTLKAFALEPGMMVRLDMVKDWVSTLTHAALHAMLYLCSDQPDVATKPSPQRGGPNRGKSKPAKPPQIHPVGWQHGPALAEARQTSTLDAGPASFRTMWTADSAQEPTVVFGHLDRTLDKALTSTTAELAEMRQKLRDVTRLAETLRARTIELDARAARDNATIAGLQASRRRLAHATLRYRAEAAAVGSPAHLDALTAQLHRRDAELTAANTTIASLTNRVQQLQQQLDQRTARQAWSPQPPVAQESISALDEVPASWLELITTATGLPHIWCSPDLTEQVNQLPPRRDWLTTTWRALHALSDYATAKHTATAAGLPSTAIRNFTAYLDSDTAGTKISATQVALRESETVQNNPRLRNQRLHRVPVDVDPSGLAPHFAHVRIGQASPYPRLHFLDATDHGGPLCIGYLGPHLQTS
ncbi:hypothetical protein ACWEOG_01770 [Amycolatopsis japonica]